MCTGRPSEVPLGDVLVDVDFGKINLLDNAEDGMLTGEVKFILYKGNHYHLTVWSDWDENVFVDTNDVWMMETVWAFPLLLKIFGYV